MDDIILALFIFMKDGKNINCIDSQIIGFNNEFEIWGKDGLSGYIFYCKCEIFLWREKVNKSVLYLTWLSLWQLFGQKMVQG